MPFINIRVTEDDHAYISALAEDAGVSLSVYIRCVVLTGQPPLNPQQAHPVTFSVFHDVRFIRRLPDAKLKELCDNADPLAARNARDELERRDRITAGLIEETAIVETDDPAPPRRAVRKRRATSRIPRHLQANNPQAKALARAMMALDDEALRTKAATSIDPVMADAAAKELERRARGIRLFRRSKRDLSLT